MDIKKTEYRYETRNGRHCTYEIVTDQDGVRWERTYRREVVLTPTMSGMVFISYGPTEISDYIRLDEQRYKGLS